MIYYILMGTPIGPPPLDPIPTRPSRKAVRAISGEGDIKNNRLRRGYNAAWWTGGDLNPYSLRNQLLRLARLPVSPPVRRMHATLDGLRGADFKPQFRRGPVPAFWGLSTAG